MSQKKRACKACGILEEEGGPLTPGVWRACAVRVRREGIFLVEQGYITGPVCPECLALYIRRRRERGKGYFVVHG